MKRPLLVVAAGLVGLLLGIGLSLVADAVAGNELSDPVPLGIATGTRVTGPLRDERAKATASPTHDAGDGGGGGDHGSNTGPGGGSDDATNDAHVGSDARTSETEDRSPEPSASPSEDEHSGSGDDGGSSGDDD